MSQPKEGKSSEGREMHYSVGAVIKKDGKYLLIDRSKPPYGYAGVAGHIDKGEGPEEALKREVKEESSLEVTDQKLLYEEELDWNWCSRGTEVHYWFLFDCDVRGDLDRNVEETESIGWYTPKEIKNLELEEVWKYWFDKLDLI